MCTQMQDLPFLCESVQMYMDTSICITNCTNATFCIYVYTQQHITELTLYLYMYTINGPPSKASLKLKIKAWSSQSNPDAPDSALQLKIQAWRSRSRAGAPDRTRV